MKKLRIVVGGYLGYMQVGGISWDFVQYPLGLFEMGHDVFYIEDTMLYPTFQADKSKWDDATSTVEHLASIMKYFGMEDRWAYRDEASKKCFGMTETQVKEICKTADIFINVSQSTYFKEEYLKIPVRILIDTDPMFTQIQYATDSSFLSRGSEETNQLTHHNYFFTFGENILADDCLIPGCGLQWIPTRQPICIEYWKKSPPPPIDESAFTTVMTWQIGKKLIFQEKEWGQKDLEFPKIMAVPAKFPDLNFSVVMNYSNISEDQFPKAEILKNQWQLKDSAYIGKDWLKYQKLIEDSLGEFSIAKETYVKSNSGWFSCRSACYMASGRPVIVQDTGWSKYYPTGKGLFSFKNEEEAVEALRKVKEDLPLHSEVARSIAEDYFDSNKVLTLMLDQVT